MRILSFISGNDAEGSAGRFTSHEDLCVCAVRIVVANGQETAIRGPEHLRNRSRVHCRLMEPFRDPVCAIVVASHNHGGIISVGCFAAGVQGPIGSLYYGGKSDSYKTIGISFRAAYL